MPNQRKITLTVQPMTLDVLRRAAVELGFVIAFGPLKGFGNVSQLLDSLADQTLTARRLYEAVTQARQALKREAKAAKTTEAVNHQ